LQRKGHRLAIVNPFHVKCTRELDDNSQTKNDKAIVLGSFVRIMSNYNNQAINIFDFANINKINAVFGC